MDNQFISLSSWPQAIMHIDADAFFASCEQAIHPELRGRPVITGKERGIVAAASYEAKARGVSRGVRLSDVKKLCPDAVILPSDYETYSLFSVRMFEILRRFSPDVEEYSIDEAFVDLTGTQEDLPRFIRNDRREDANYDQAGARHHRVRRRLPLQGPREDRLEAQETGRPHHDPRPGHPCVPRETFPSRRYGASGRTRLPT